MCNNKIINSYQVPLMSQISQPDRRRYCLIFISILVTQTIMATSQGKTLTYYVSLSSSTRDGWCSTHNHNSCFNITEVATAIITEGSTLNISLVLIPGNHTLLSNLTVAGCAHFLMKSEDSLQPAIINCGVSSRLRNNTGIHFSANVHIHGIILNGCVENEVKGVKNLTIEDSTLSAGISNSVPGRALVVSNSAVAIVRSTLKYFTRPMIFSQVVKVVQSSVYRVIY